MSSDYTLRSIPSDDKIATTPTTQSGASLAAPVPPVAGGTFQDWDVYIGIHCVATIRAETSEAAARLFIESPSSLTARPLTELHWFYIYAGDLRIGLWNASSASQAIAEFLVSQSVIVRPSPLQLF